MKKLKLKDISLFKKKLLDIIIKIVENLRLRIDHQNLFRIYKLLLSFKANVIFIVEEGGWVIEWEARFITNNLRKLRLIDAEIATNFLVKKKIIHWGSVNCLIRPNGLARFNNSNVNVLTWYHIVPGDNRLKFVPLLNKKLDLLHTPSLVTKGALVDSGFDEKRISVVPIGVDLNQFKCFDQKKRRELRKKFKLPLDKIIIGSFQKDGQGMGEGLIPKLVKGPDIFCDLVKKIHKEFDIHVFLTGPARGYVKKKLEDDNIPYTHIFLKDFLDIVECYNVLDLYIVTSRVEGGPKALLEGMATGVPLVTTKVGMATYLIKDGINGFITEVNDINQLYRRSMELIQNEYLRQEFVKNNLKIIQEYSWEKIAKKYYFDIYQKFLKS